jgi:hypothetical protein
MGNQLPRRRVQARAKTPNHMFRYCRVVGCHNPARAGTENGLDTTFCRKHADHYSRHGSPYRGSYSAKDLAPYRRAVRRWLAENREDQWVKNACCRVEGLYERAGPHVEAFRLAGMSARERAWAAWARLRKAGIEPLKPIEAWLVIEQAIAFDEQPEAKPEFKRVQAAKLVHRMASGSHKVWEREVPRRIANHFTTEVHRTELHVYPHSRGRVLRHIGADLEEACGLLVDQHLGALIEASSRY